MMTMTTRRPSRDVDPLNEADWDRFATLFSPATPPATPTDTSPPPPLPRPRNRSQSSSDSDFGAFVSVPPSQDPLGHVDALRSGDYPSLGYFDQFTSTAKTAAARHRREVLDELLEHEDDPMYFLSAPSPPPIAISPIPIPASSPMPTPTATDEALAEALASEMHNPNLIRGGSVKVSLSPSRARLPLPPRLSGSASPPSTSSPTASPPTSRSPPLASSSTSLAAAQHAYPAHATLSRLSSSLVSLLPTGRPRSTAPTMSASSVSAPSTFSRLSSPNMSGTLTHGSPFASTPYVPPSGAPGFIGDRAWDRGFSDALAQDETRGLVDPTGLGVAVSGGADTTARAHHGVTLVGRWETTARVLDEVMAHLIRPQLPALMRLARHWTLLYSIDQHGISINTLYTRCEPRLPTRSCPTPPKGGLLVLRDAHDACFGAWLSEGIKLEKGGYYGSGEAFLWRYHPALSEDGRQGRLRLYPWTGVNAYVALCEPGFISFGGGDGHYGLYVDETLLEGSSAPCPTFGNPPLCVPDVGQERVKPRGDVSFECVGLEVWGIGA